MSSCGNFAFLSPLLTFEELNSGYFIYSQSSIEAIWLLLSQLDVNSIKDDELEKISSLWCESLISARIYNFKHKPKLTTNLFYSYCLVSEVSYSLFQRLLKKNKELPSLDLERHLYDPILSLFGFIDNIFDDFETPTNYPIKISPIFDNPSPVIEFFKQHLDLPNYDIIISWSLRFIFSNVFYQIKDKNELAYSHLDAIKEIIDPNGEYLFDPKVELEKQTKDASKSEEKDDKKSTEFDKFIKTKDEIPLISILLIRYCFANIFNIKFEIPISAPNANFYDNFYNNVIFQIDGKPKLDVQSSKSLSEEEKMPYRQNIGLLAQTLLFVSGPKISLPPKLFENDLIPPDFITASFLSGTIDVDKVDVVELYDKEPVWRNAILFLFSKLKTAEDFDKFEKFANSKQFSDGFINEARGCCIKLQPIDRLIIESFTDANAAKLLLDHPDCFNLLMPDLYVLHKILVVLLSGKPMPLPKEFKMVPKAKPKKPSSEAQNKNAPVTPTGSIQASPETPANADQTGEKVSIETQTQESQQQEAPKEAEEKVPDLSNAEAAIIYKAIQFHFKLDLDLLISALHSYLIQVVESITKSAALANLALAGFDPNSDAANRQLESVRIPRSASDLVESFYDQPFPMIFDNVYMILLYLLLTNGQNSLIEKSMELMADLCGNCFFSPLLKSIVQRSLPASFSDFVEKRRMKFILQQLENKEKRANTLEIIMPALKTDYKLPQLLTLSKFFVEQNDHESFITFISSLLTFSHEIASTASLEFQEKVFDILLEKNDSVKIKAVFPLLLQSNPLLFKKLGVIALKSPKLLDPLFDVCNMANKVFIEAISTFSGEITAEFAQMLKKMIRSLPIYPVIDDGKETPKPRMNVNWDNNSKESVAKIDPWHDEYSDEDKIAEIKEHNTGKYHCFFCYTCGICGGKSEICLNCALKCHRGHDVVYNGLDDNPCACGKDGKCTCYIDNKDLQAKIPKKVKRVKSKSKAVVSRPEENSVKYFDSTTKENANLLISLFNSLINSKLMKPPDPLSVCRLSQSIFDVDITKFNTQSVVSRFRLASVQSNPSEGTQAGTGDENERVLPVSLLPKVIMSLDDIINEIQNQSSTYERHFQYRLQSMPLFTAAVGGPLCNILVVASNHTLTSYNIETMQVLSTCRLRYPGLQLSFCPLDPSVLAIASLKHVMIYSVSDNGNFEESEEIMLLLEEISPSIFVISIVWVPLEALHLAVVCNSFIKIYDIPSDRYSPISCFTIDSPHFFSSAVFVEHEDECYGLFAMSNGLIAIQNTNVDASDGPIPLTRFAPFSKFNNAQLTLSYSPESDILFISSPPSPLVAMRLDEIFKESNPLFLPINLPPTLNVFHFYFVHCINGSLHFFVNPATGNVFTVEFVDNQTVEVAFLSPLVTIPNNGPDTFPLLSRSIVTLTTFVMEEKLYAIGKYGKVLMLQSMDAIDNSGDDDDEDDSNEETERESKDNSSPSEFCVPLTFWTHVKTAPKSIVNISAPGIHDSDPSVLLSGNSYAFPGILRSKCLDISLKDENVLIVGFRIISLNRNRPRSRPSFVQIFNRKYSTLEPKSLCIPLRKEEVRPKRRYKIFIGDNKLNKNNDVYLDYIEVLTISAAELDDEKMNWVKTKEFDWFKDGNEVFDFVDLSQIVKRSQKLSINADSRIFNKKIKLGNDTMSIMLNNLSLALPSEFVVDDAMIEKLIQIMYTMPDWSIAARRLVVKAASADRKKKIVEIWAKTLEKLVLDGKINNKQWGLVWRDVSLLPPELKKEVAPVVWKSKPQLSGTFTALTAFLTQ